MPKIDPELQLYIQERDEKIHAHTENHYAKKWAEKAWVWLINGVGVAVLAAILKLILL